ncbi:oligosaccharide flippase family protein [Candidatus Woesebacteria bacterium]|nr:oligosaccharide flippase family protein [Candidatus Woesebacteria bacterium]
MKNYAKYLISHPLFSGSMVMIIGNNLANAFQYLFHLLMGRLLGPSGYAELVSIVSISALLGMVPFSLGLVIVKFISAEKNKNKIVSLASWVERKSFLFGLLVGILVLAASPFISNFLHITNTQLIFAVALVLAGYRVFGALLGSLIAGIIALLMTRVMLKGYLGKVSKRPDIAPLIKYSIPVLLMTISVTSFYSMDLVLVKHYFPTFEAGIYSSLSTLGKIVFFGVSPVFAVMFPLVSQRQARGEGFRKIFLYSLVIALAIILGVLAVYRFLPELAISVLFGKDYLSGASLLFLFGIFVGILALSSLFLNFFVSLGKTKIVFVALAAATLQIAGIYFFHGDLKTVILVSISAVSVLFLLLLLYSIYEATRGEI